MKLEIVTMTPDQALEILASNTSNRRMRKSVVTRYSRAIKAGQWKLTQQGVAISRDGVLLDGQHRLAAIIEAEIPVPMVVATDCDPSIFSVLDTGATRLASDVLHVNGGTNTVACAAGLKNYILFQRHPERIWTGGNLILPSHSDIAEIHSERIDEVAFASSVSSATYTLCRHTNKSALVAFVLLAIDAGYDRRLIESFCNKIGSGAGLGELSPILRLRSALINGVIQCRGRRGNTPQIHIACMIKTFNYWIGDVSLRLFKVPAIPPMPTLIKAGHD